MKVIVDGMKDNNIRFTCECCSCVFEANENEDGFSVIGKEQETEWFDSDDFEEDPVTRFKSRMVDKYCVTKIKAMCTCPNCGSVAFGGNTYRRYIGREAYLRI